jgi:hypothetical protein
MSEQLSQRRRVRHTIAMSPAIQNALPTGTGWNRNTSAYTIPPRLLIPPTTPLCARNVNLICPAYNKDLTMKPLEPYKKVVSRKCVCTSGDWYSQGLQWGTSEKLTPFAASFAMARMTIIPITVATMFQVSILQTNWEIPLTRRMFSAVDIQAETKRYQALYNAQGYHEVLLSRNSPSPIHYVAEVSTCPESQ